MKAQAPPPSPATSPAGSPAVASLKDNPVYRAALEARASRKAMRIALAEARGRDPATVARVGADQRIVADCEKAMSKREEAVGKRLRHQAEEEAAKQAKADKQAAKQAESAVKIQRKAEEKKQYTQRKGEQKAAKAAEKERRRYMGGMSWGYDPNAGVATCLPADIQTSRYQSRNRDSDSRRTSGTSGSAESGPKYYDRVTGQYYRKSEFDTALGVEVGGPNRTQPPGALRDRSPVDDTSYLRHSGPSHGRGPDGDPLVDVKGKERAES